MCGVSITGDTQRCLDMALDSPALGGPSWAGQLDQMTSRGPFQPQPVCGFVIKSIFFFPNSNQALKYQQILKGIFIPTAYPCICFCFGLGLFVCCFKHMKLSKGITKELSNICICNSSGWNQAAVHQCLWLDYYVGSKTQGPAGLISDIILMRILNDWCDNNVNQCWCLLL